MRKTAPALVATACVIATFAAGCSTKSSGGSTAKSTPSTPTGSASSSASGVLGQGVTADTIKIGIFYPDLDAIKQFVNLTHGSYKVAYTAVINQINGAGGINGRKIVPFFAPVNPIGTAPADAACTKLTQDDKVFAVLGNVSDPTCYLTTHGVPLVGSIVSSSQAQGAKASWFNYQPTNEQAIVKILAALEQNGTLKGKKVGVVGGTDDQADLKNVALPELRKLGANVVQTAINSAPASDVNAGYQQFGLIASKFQASGVDLVVAVGNAGSGWPKALQVNRSTYHPTLVATYRNALASYVADAAGNDPTILAGAVSGDGSPPTSVGWNDPTLKSCVATVQAAEPNAKINDPVGATAKTPNTWVAPTYACVNMALLVDVAKAAGKTLNNDTFTSGGESLTDVSLPGFPGIKLHFSASSHDGDGPVYLSTYDTTKKNLVVQPTPYQ